MTLARTTGLSRLALVTVLLGLLPAVPVAEAKRPQGINVSQAQKEIDWQQVAAASRFEFAYIRASEGLSGRDRFYGTNYTEARDAGLTVGSFHRAYMSGGNKAERDHDARDEAQLFLDVTETARADDLVPILTIDPPFGGLRPRQIIRWADIWLTKVRRALGVQPGIYTSSAIWLDCCLDTKRFARAGHRLWIQSYDVSKPIVPADDWAGRSWTFWQKSIGDVQGIDKPVNKNVVTYRSLRPVLVRANRL